MAVPPKAEENLTENEVAYFRRVHKLAPPITPEGEEQTGFTEEEVDYFRKVHQLPEATLAATDERISEAEVEFFRQLHRIPAAQDQAETQQVSLRPEEIQYFRKVHDLPTPQGPEYETRNRLTEEEVDYFKKVHRLPARAKDQSINSLSKSLEPAEVKFFRTIHSLALRIPAESDSKPAPITEHEIAHFRKVHRLPDPTKESELYKSRLTDQEMDYFRLVHMLPIPIQPEYQSEVFGLNFSSDLNSKASKSKESNLGVREKLIRDTSKLIEALQADQKIEAEKKVLDDMKKSHLIPAKDLQEARKFVEASQMLEANSKLSDSGSKSIPKKNELSVNDIPFFLTSSEVKDDLSLSVVLPERLLHIQPIIEEECRINNAQIANNNNVDDKRTELDDNLRKAPTKVFLGQKPVLSKLGDEVRKVMQSLYDQKKAADQYGESPEKVKISISGTSPKQVEQIQDILERIRIENPKDDKELGPNSILPERKPIIPDGLERAEVLDLLEEFLVELRKNDVEDVEFQTIIGASPALNIEELTQKIQDDKIMDKKLTPQERLALLKGVIRRNLKTEKPIAVAYDDVDSKKQIEDHLSLLKKKTSPQLKQLKDLKTFTRDLDKKVKSPLRSRRLASLTKSQLNLSKSNLGGEDRLANDATKIVLCDQAISEAVDAIFCIKIDSLSKEIELAIKLLENNTLKGLLSPLPLREPEEVVFDIIKANDMEFSEEFCTGVDEDLETLN